MFALMVQAHYLSNLPSPPICFPATMFVVSRGVDFNVALWKTKFPDASPERVPFAYADNGRNAPILAWNYSDEFMVITAGDAPVAPSYWERRVYQHMSCIAQIMIIPQTYEHRGHKTCAQFVVEQATNFLHDMEAAMDLEIISDSDCMES